MVSCSVWIDGILSKITKHLLNNKTLTHKIYFINISYPPFCSLHGILCKQYAKSYALSVLFCLVVMFQRFNANAPKYGYIQLSFWGNTSLCDKSRYAHSLYSIETLSAFYAVCIATQFLSSFYSAFLTAYFVLCADSAL